MSKPTALDVDLYRVHPDTTLDLADRPTRAEPVSSSHADQDALLAAHVKSLDELQARLWAADRQAVLLVLQGMDAAGKDGVIRHVMTGLNPEGCSVTAFKQPSQEELRHDFLWRAAKALPERGLIGIFNRSYYEEVLIVRVHGELLDAEGLDPDKAKGLWAQRYRSIRHFESHLRRNDTKVVKVFLHLSKDEQRKRFLARIDEPAKNWKLSTADVTERQYWDRYQGAYAACLSATSTRHAPWWVVPADDKVSARLIVSQILLNTLEDINPKWPKSTPAHRAELQDVRKQLTKP
jgi:PPK2 family polyphosphate:nucleotide phosphotransferase